jgi:hypothetical protein
MALCLRFKEHPSVEQSLKGEHPKIIRVGNPLSSAPSSESTNVSYANGNLTQNFD